ncbi:MAG TPA: adenosylcobinamide-phosphate synthase CbiB [Polyangiales bacterium]
MSAPFEAAGVLVLAWLLDCWVGEPPARLHPVVWMGLVIAPLSRLGRRSPVHELVLGALYAAGVAGGFGLAAMFALRSLEAWPVLHVALQVYLLWSCFALRGLLAAGRAMQAALARADLEGARDALRSLCSRDPSQLTEPELAGATIESISENSSDSVVAPLFYFALLGVPGAVFYRAANTLDAMVGYRGRFEYLGKLAARLDDLLNLVPARLATLCLWCSGALLRLPARVGGRVWWRDGLCTESPNAGQVMAMTAGLLGVRLDKRDAYVLGAELRAPDASALAQALRLVQLSGWLFASLLLAALVLWGTLHVHLR